MAHALFQSGMHIGQAQAAGVMKMRAQQYINTQMPAQQAIDIPDLGRVGIADGVRNSQFVSPQLHCLFGDADDFARINLSLNRAAQCCGQADAKGDLLVLWRGITQFRDLAELLQRLFPAASHVSLIVALGDGQDEAQLVHAGGKATLSATQVRH